MVNVCVGDKEVLQVLNKNLLTLEGYSANTSREDSVLLSRSALSTMLEVSNGIPAGRTVEI